MPGVHVRPVMARGWRYTLVGLTCALSNYVVMLAVDYAGGHYLLGTLVSFTIVTPLGYALHSRFTFAESFRLKAFLRFTASVAFTYPVAVAVLALLCSGLGLSVALALPIATCVLFAWNLVAAHWAILSRFQLGRVVVHEDPAAYRKSAC